MASRNELVKPRNGRTLVVGIVARISGCANQKEASLEDQIENAKETIRDIYKGPIEFREISTIAKGESLDRPELDEVRALLESRDFDFFVFDDLSRLVRGGEATKLLGLGADNGVRSICICDGIDTIDDTWEEDALNACSENVANNSRTSKRIKQKMMLRFKRRGIVPTRLIAGYSAPSDATCYADWRKIDAASAFITEGHNILLATKNCSACADYFNRVGFQVGPHCRNNRWDGAMVRRFYANPILKGKPGRGFKHTRKIHGTGRRKSFKNPEGPVFRDEPHLAHLTADDFDALNNLLTTANANVGRKPVNGIDPLLRRPRKRTRFPGQHASCWYCGRQYIWGGNGIADNLVCSGARTWSCWNTIGFNGAFAARAIIEQVWLQLSGLTGIEQQMSALVRESIRSTAANVEDAEVLSTEQSELDRKKRNLTDAIAEYGPQDTFSAKLVEIETAQRILLERRRKLQILKDRQLGFPTSIAELRQQLKTELQELAIDSFESGQFLRLLVPEFCVYLVRMFDGGHPVPRARIKLSLSGSISHAHLVPGLQDLLTRELTIDLFQPPQREQFRGDAVRLAKEGLNQHEIALRLGITQAAVSKSLLLNGDMTADGLSNPYIILREPPTDYPKLRRHKNPRYNFTRVEGYVPRPI